MIGLLRISDIGLLRISDVRLLQILGIRLLWILGIGWLWILSSSSSPPPSSSWSLVVGVAVGVAGKILDGELREGVVRHFPGGGRRGGDESESCDDDLHCFFLVCKKVIAFSTGFQWIQSAQSDCYRWGWMLNQKTLAYNVWRASKRLFPPTKNHMYLRRYVYLGSYYVDLRSYVATCTCSYVRS